MSGGRKSMMVRVARNSIVGAAMRACRGRNAAATVQCARAGTEFRSEICPLEATLGTASMQDHEHRLPQNPEVQSQTPVLDVFQVEGHVPLKRWVAPGGDLPQSGDSRGDVEAAQMLQAILPEVVERMRPGADHAHL